MNSRRSPALGEKVGKFFSLPKEEMRRQMEKGFYGHTPYALFLLMPVFALWLKLLYLGSGRRYGEHLLFALPRVRRQPQSNAGALDRLDAAAPAGLFAGDRGGRAAGHIDGLSLPLPEVARILLIYTVTGRWRIAEAVRIG